MKNKEPLLAAISRISNSEYYADDELNFLIKENIPNDSLALPAALSVVDISEENEIIASNFREALRAFANEAPSDQHQQLVAPISVNKSLHFAGLHIKRNADNSFKATYIDPLGAEPKPPYKLANTTIIKKSNEDESAGLFGLLNQASQYFGLAESTEAENLRISLNQVLPHSSIPFHIINALELELGIAPQDIALTTTKIQHPSNNHCGAFTAEILTSLANQSISISENRLTIGDDRKQISDLDQDSSDAVGKVFRENQAEALKEFFDISKKPEKTSSKNSLKKEKNTNSQAIKKSTAFNFQPSKIGLGLLLLSSFSELTDSQGVPPPPSKSTAPTPTPSSSLVTKTPTNSPSYSPSAAPSILTSTPSQKPSSYAPTSNSPTNPPTTNPSSSKPSTFRPTVSLPTPTISPTFQPSTLFPTIEATDDKYPTSIPSSVPSSSNPTLDSASNSPTSNPSQKPSSARPTTNKPSSYAPSELPTIPEEESDEPTTDPTQSPSSFRPNTSSPTSNSPTVSPTFQPSTLFPTIEATDDKYPTSIPSSVPSSSNPTLDSASNNPTSNPSQKPSSARPTTNKPSSYAPSELPTIPEEESDEPTTDPTQFPSSFRPSSSSPTSNSPTILETEEPSISPSLSPTSENPKTPTNTTALRSFDEEDVIAVEGLSISSGLVAGSIIRAASSEWRKLPVKFVAETLSTTLLAAGASNSAAVNIFANSAANLLVYSSEVALETVATSYFFESEVGRENNGKDKDENIVNKRRRAAATKASTETDVENNLSPEEKAAITSAIANGLLHALGTAAWAGKPKKEHDIAPFLTLALCGAELDKTSENLLKNFSGQEAKNRDGEWFRKLKNAYHQHLITDGYESVDLTKLQDSLSRALRALSNETKTRVGTRELRHKVKDKFYNPKYRNKSLDEEGQESLRQDLKKLGEELLPRLFSKSDSADIESQTAEPVSYEIIANKLREVLTQHHTAHESLSNLLNSHDKNSQPIDEFNSKIAKLTQVKDSSPNPVIKKAAEKILGFLNESGTSSFDKEGKLINLEAVSILNGINSPLPTISLYAKSVEGKFLDECTGLLDRNKDSELEIIDVEITDEVIGENYFGMTPALNEKADLGRVHRSADVAKNLFPVRRDPSAVGVDFNEIAQSPLNKSTRKKPNPSSSKTSKSNPNAIYSSDHFDEEKKSDYSDEEEKEDQLRAPIVTKPGAKFIQTSQGQHIHPQKTNKHSASAAKKVAISNKETELSSPSLVRPNSQKIPPIPKFENSESYPSRTLNATPRDINSEQSLKNSESNLSLNKINFDDSFNSPQLKRASNHLIRDKQVDLYLPYKRSETDNTKFTLIEDSNEKGEYPILYFHDSESGKVRDFVGYEAIRDSEFSSFLPKDEEEKTIVISNDDQTNFSQLERRFVQTPNKSSGAKPVNIIHCHRVFFSNNISQGDEIEYIESRYQKKYVSLDSSNTPHELTHIQNTPSGQIVSAKKPQRSGSNRDDFLLKDSNKNPDTPSSSLIKRLFPEGSFATTPVATPKNQSGKGK
jgi:hypothetical protein